MTPRGNTVCLLFLFFIAGTLAEDTSPSPSPAPEGEIGPLIADLGHPAFDRRSAARARLTVIGDPAIPALLGALEHHDPEVRCSAGAILKTLGIQTPDPEMAARIDRLARTLETTRDASEGARAYAELEGLGIIARGSIEKIFKRPSGKPALRMTAAQSGRTVRVALENAGDTPAWISVSRFSCVAHEGRTVPLSVPGAAPREGYDLLRIPGRGSIELSLDLPEGAQAAETGRIAYLPLRRPDPVTLTERYMEALRQDVDEIEEIDRRLGLPDPSDTGELTCAIR